MLRATQPDLVSIVVYLKLFAGGSYRCAGESYRVLSLCKRPLFSENGPRFNSGVRDLIELRAENAYLRNAKGCKAKKCKAEKCKHIQSSQM